MRKLDENKVYDLSELTRVEWKRLTNSEKCAMCYYEYVEGIGWVFKSNESFTKEVVNARELFYTLENIQVDCRGLSYDQIEKLLSVVDGKLDPLNSSFDVYTECLYLSFNKYCHLFGFYGFDEEQHLITYEKFMELFGNKVKSKENLTLENIQVDCRELTEEQIKDICKVFETNGYKVGEDDWALNVSYASYLLEFTGSEVFVSVGSEEKTTITYEKFMKLFTDQVADVGGMVVEKTFKYTDTFARMEANCTIEECLAFAKGSIDSYNWNTKEQNKEDFEKIISYANWVVRLILLYVSKDEIIKWLEEEGNKLKLK